MMLICVLAPMSGFNGVYTLLFRLLYRYLVFVESLLSFLFLAFIFPLFRYLYSALVAALCHGVFTFFFRYFVFGFISSFFHMKNVFYLVFDSG